MINQRLKKAKKTGKQGEKAGRMKYGRK